MMEDVMVCVVLTGMPKSAVPSPIATAQDRITQVGTCIPLRTPADTSASVMTPIAFCASFAPWLNAMKLDEINCNRRNARLAVPRGTLDAAPYVARITKY